MTLTDFLTLSDSLRVQLNLLQHQVALSDSLALGDGIQLKSQNIQIRLLADILEIVDTAIVNQQYPTSRPISDNVLISDSLQLLLDNLLHLSDQLALSDSLRIRIGLALSLSDTLVLSDSAAPRVSVTIVLNLSDTLSLSDALEDSLSSELDLYLRRYLNDVS